MFFPNAENLSMIADEQRDEYGERVGKDRMNEMGRLMIGLRWMFTRLRG